MTAVTLHGHREATLSSIRSLIVLGKGGEGGSGGRRGEERGVMVIRLVMNDACEREAGEGKNRRAACRHTQTHRSSSLLRRIMCERYDRDDNDNDDDDDDDDNDDNDDKKAWTKKRKKGDAGLAEQYAHHRRATRKRGRRTQE